MITENTTIFDLYVETSRNIASKVIVDCANDKINNKKTESDYYAEKYISDYVFKDSLIEQHYQLVGYLSFMAKSKYSANELTEYFNIDNDYGNFSEYSNPIDCLDDYVLNLVFNVMIKLVNREIKANEFK